MWKPRVRSELGRKKMPSGSKTDLEPLYMHSIIGCIPTMKCPLHIHYIYIYIHRIIIIPIVSHCITIYPWHCPYTNYMNPWHIPIILPSNYIAMISQPDLSVTPWDPPADPGAERCRSLQSAACASPEEAQRRRSAFSQAMSNTSF